jgi:hypothetical protein
MQNDTLLSPLKDALVRVMPTPGLCRAEAIFWAFGCIPTLADAA